MPGCKECGKKLNKAITISLSKLMNKSKKKKFYDPLADYVFDKDDFADFIMELRRCLD